MASELGTILVVRVLGVTWCISIIEKNVHLSIAVIKKTGNKRFFDFLILKFNFQKRNKDTCYNKQTNNNKSLS